jgi:hypothetical protein
MPDRLAWGYHRVEPGDITEALAVPTAQGDWRRFYESQKAGDVGMNLAFRVLGILYSLAEGGPDI